MWIKTLVYELGVSIYGLLKLICDNVSALHIDKSPILDCHFVRDKVLNKSLCIDHFISEHQLKNVLTKPLSSINFVQGV